MSSNINRRALLMAGAVTTLPTIAAMAGSAADGDAQLLALGARPDPIFAAIAECRAAITKWAIASAAEARLETALINACRASVENPVHVASQDQRYIAAKEETERCFDEADEAAMALLDVKPTTVAGAAALLRLGFEPNILQTWWQWPENVSEDSSKFDGHDWFAVLSNHVAEALAEIEDAGNVASAVTPIVAGTDAEKEQS
jgi:hypothetical protein